jgi:hypothetical protein
LLKFNENFLDFYMKTRYNYIVDIQNIFGVSFDHILTLFFIKKLVFLGKNGKKCHFFMLFF